MNSAQQLASVMRLATSDSLAAFDQLRDLADRPDFADETFVMASCWLDLAELLAAEGHGGRADEALECARATMPDDPDAAVRLDISRARVAAHTDMTQAFTLAARADTAASGLADPMARVATLSLVTELCVASGEDETAVQVAQALEQIARGANDLETMVAATCLRAESLLRLGQDREAFEIARKAHTQAMQHGTWRARAAEARGVAARRAGEILEARESFDAAVAAWSGDVPPRLALEHAICHVAFDGGNPDLEATLTGLSDSDDAEISHGARMARFDIVLERGDTEAATTLLNRSRQAMTDADVLAATLRVELATGDDESARKSAARLTAISDADDHALLAIDAVLAAGDAVRAVAALDTRVENARAASNANLEGAALVRRSLALALLGDCEAAGADASRAMALARARFAPSAYVSAARLVVMSLLEREMIDQALDQLDDAVGWLERTGAGTRALMMTVFEANVQLEATGDPELPGDHEDMLRHGTTLNHPQAATLAHISLARLAHGQGDEVAAQEHLGSAKALDARGALGLHDLIERVSHAMNLYAASA